MSFNPYLFFSGNCAEAFERYGAIFGGDLQVMTHADLPEGAEPMPGAELLRPPEPGALRLAGARTLCGPAASMPSCESMSRRRPSVSPRIDFAASFLASRLESVS